MAPKFLETGRECVWASLLFVAGVGASVRGKLVSSGMRVSSPARANNAGLFIQVQSFGSWSCPPTAVLAGFTEPREAGPFPTGY